MRNSRFNLVGFWLAGVPQEHIVDQSATRMGRVALGYALLIAPILGGTGAFATMRALGFGEIGASGTALTAALILLVLDRAIFIGLGKKGGWFSVVIRLLAAGVVNTLVSHVFVLSLFSGEIEREQRGVLATEIQVEKNASQARIAELSAPFVSQNKGIEDELKASQTTRKTLLNRGEELEKELTQLRAKLDDEYQGKRASGIALPGPETRRLEALIGSLEKRRSGIAKELTDCDAGIAKLIGQLQDVSQRQKHDPELLAEAAASAKRIDNLRSAQRGDLLSRTRALHAIMGQNPELLGLYLLILAALFLLDTAAILTKATAPHDAVDFRRAMEMRASQIDMEVFLQQYPAVAAAKFGSQARLDMIGADIRTAKQISVAKVKEFVLLLAELSDYTKDATAIATTLTKPFMAERNGLTHAEDLKGLLLASLTKVVEAAMRDFVGEQTPMVPSAVAAAPPMAQTEHTSTPRAPMNRHSFNGSTTGVDSEQTL